MRALQRYCRQGLRSRKSLPAFPSPVATPFHALTAPRSGLTRRGAQERHSPPTCCNFTPVHPLSCTHCTQERLDKERGASEALTYYLLQHPATLHLTHPEAAWQAAGRRAVAHHFRAATPCSVPHAFRSILTRSGAQARRCSARWSVRSRRVPSWRPTSTSPTASCRGPRSASCS